ncbi:tyrosine--tRNA ligase [Nanoarchaeota archaeon]
MYFHVLLGTECNSQCRYCYTKSCNDFGNDLSKKFKIDFSMPPKLEYSIEDLKKFVKAEEGKSPHVLTFYGGEPLMHIEKIKETMDSIDARYMIQTNGLLLDKLGKEYVNRFDIMLISLDGDKAITDFNRGKGTYERVMKNIDLIKKNGFKGELIARMVVDEHSMLSKQVKHLVDVGFTSIHWQLDAGFKVKILLADIHGALDNTPWDVLERRYGYYEAVIPTLIKSMGVDIKDLEIVKGSTFQLKKEFMYDVLRFSTFASMHDTHKAASEVVKQGDNPKLAGLIYPVMQALDEVYLEADAQLGGTDQRKIFVLARETLPKLGYKPRVEVINPFIPGLIGKKMSSSIEKSKIDFLDDEKTVLEKVKSADFVAGSSDNGVMAFLKYIVFTLKGDKKEKFVIERPEKYGGNLEFSKYEEVEKLVLDKKIHPLDLKNAVAKEVNNLLVLFRKNKAKFEKLAKIAYS